jgi:hypothetical protein
MDLLLSLEAVNLKDHEFEGIESLKDILERALAARGGAVPSLRKGNMYRAVFGLKS